MTDFKKSLFKGLEAADSAAKIRREIDEVFDMLNEQLDEATGGKIEIKRAEEIRLGSGIIGGISTILGDSRTVHVLQCRGKIANYSETLAGWKTNRNGYPAEIKLGSEEILCMDRTTLEKGIEYMLSDPIVGEKIANIMSLQIEKDF